MGKGGGPFERLLDKATSQLLLETDWESILQICDLIRQGDAQAKYAISAIKKKLNDKNPHVVLYTLEVLESVVKNCGQTVHDEVANKQTMEDLKELFKKQTETNVRNKILQLIQAWAQAFRNEPKYKVVQDTYQIMKVEGNVFPELKESDAMFLSERAPDWVDAEECHRCRVQFGVVTRKHHCRACGQIFCGKCSSKSSTIPKFGIEKEVRVCEPCFEQLNKKEDLDSSNMKSETKPTASAPVDLPPEYLTSPLSQQSQLPPKRDEAALQEEEELQLAIALSQSEAEEKERMLKLGKLSTEEVALDAAGSHSEVTAMGRKDRSTGGDRVTEVTATEREGSQAVARNGKQLNKLKLGKLSTEEVALDAAGSHSEVTAMGRKDRSTGGDRVTEVTATEREGSQAVARNGKQLNKRQKSTYSMYPKPDPTPVTSSAPPVSSLYSSPVNSSAPTAEEIDPELARYLNRTYWEKKQEEVRKSPTPSAPVSVVESVTQPVETHPAPITIVEQQYQNGESEENHEQFLKALQNSVATFVNRMKSDHVRGRSITNDTAVLSLFQSINSMHPQLLELLNQLDEKRLYYEGLQDKLAQIRDARGALNALREEHSEKLRREAEEAERQRQIQLAQKLEIMRQKKQEYLEMQRQLAIQRLQEQEKERQMRLEQQKQTIQMRAQMPAFPLPYAQLQSMPPATGVMYQPSGPTSFPATFSPSGSVEGSPMHSVYMNQPGTGPYPSMTVSGTDPAMVNPYMYQAAAPTNQTSQQGQAVPTTNTGYSNYQPTPTQNYQNVVSQAQNIPALPQSQSGGLGYMGSQSVPMGYQPYNMQNMMSALPPQEASMSNLPPQQPYLPAQQPMYQQMGPPGAAQQQQSQPPPPPQVQQQPGSEAQLISFD